MELEAEVLKFIGEYSSMVEEAVEKHVPKNFTLSYLVTHFGEARFKHSPEPLTEGLSKPFWELFSRGGKRWRPALTILTFETLGGRAEEVAFAAAVPEIIHNATLIVDDVEDSSLLRRGKPCIHHIYGLDVAVNAGNALYYLPIYLLAQKTSGKTRQLLLEKYVEMMTKLSFGQTMDIVWHRGLVPQISEEDYLQMASYKTGALSRFAVEIACIYAGKEDLLDVLGTFGESIGTAFQIQDDYLNIFGEEEKYRKEIGGDITEGKYTLMTVYALRHLPPEKSSRLRKILASHTSDPELMKEAIYLIKDSGAGDYAKNVSRKIVEEAWKAAEKYLLDSPAKTKLKKLTSFLIERTL